MNHRIETSVLIVGAGPVGLTLAMDLASRGIEVTVTEIRRAGEPPNVKCNQVSARSMEIFRRLGSRGKSANRTAAGIPQRRGLLRDGDRYRAFAHLAAVAGRTRPRREGRRRLVADGRNGRHRINQLFLEPVLFAHAAAQPRIRILNRTQFEEMSQNDTA